MVSRFPVISRIGLVLFLLLTVLASPVAAESADGGWISAIVDEVQVSAAPSLVYDSGGVAHAAYYNSSTGTIMHAWRTGNTWTTEVVGQSAGTYTVSMALAPDGTLGVSYGNGLHYGNLMYATKGPDGFWTPTVVDRGGSAYTRCAVGCVAGAVTSGNVGHYSSLAYDSKGNLHIVYNDGTHYASLYYATLNQSSKSWEIYLIDDNGFGGDTGYHPSLTIDAAGHLHVAYQEGKSASTIRYATSSDGKVWTTTKVGNGVTPSLALDSKGSPHISYVDVAAQELQYASWDGATWNIENADVQITQDAHPSLAFDHDGIPYISYYDASNNMLKSWYPVSWRSNIPVRIIDWRFTDSLCPAHDIEDVWQFPSLALSPEGHPSILYYDPTNHKLRFTRGPLMDKGWGYLELRE